MKLKKHYVTLLETVIAVAILGMALAGLFQLSAQARKRTVKSIDAWTNTHRLMEGAEYVLLHGDSVKSIPERFFPYKDCKIEIAWEDMADIHPEYTAGSVAGQPELKACKISLIRISDGKTLDQIIVDRITYQNGLQQNE